MNTDKMVKELVTKGSTYYGKKKMDLDTLMVLINEVPEHYKGKRVQIQGRDSDLNTATRALAAYLAGAKEIPVKKRITNGFILKLFSDIVSGHIPWTPRKSRLGFYTPKK